VGRAELKRELIGVALLLLAVFLAGALAVERAPVGISCTEETRIFGPVGSCVRAVIAGFMGLPAFALIVAALAVHGLRMLGRVEANTDRSWLLCLLGLAAVLPIGFGLAAGADRTAGALSGWWGGMLAFYFARAFGMAGAWILVVLLLSAVTVATLRWNPLRALMGARVLGSLGAAAARAKSMPAALALEPAPEEMPAMDPSLDPALDDAAPEPKRAKSRKRRSEENADDESAQIEFVPAARASRAPVTREERIAAEIDATEHVPDDVGEAVPPTDLLVEAPQKHVEQSRRELDAMGQKLMDALRTFKVEGELGGRTTGPVVTQFEVVPAAGVKVRQIANLSDDLALAMRAPSIRIVAPIPGKGAVGVEVPNPTPEMVYFRDLIESNAFRQARAALPIALGKDLEGHPVVADLAKMPHLLIAGATGSGKSVCVNTIVTSLIYRHSPRTLRFLMVDPKMVELSVYNSLPHLRHKVITDNRDAAAVLKWAVMEMQERYALLAANGCRNLQDFNRRVQAHANGEGPSLKTPPRPDVAFEDRTYKGGIIPYIVVIIDELADLMMTVQGEVETPLAMLAQKARAIGIHLILATQRPSVNVITGLIKANFPSRIAFRVASQVDSRTILDGVGAEALLGNGDMLFIPPGKSEPNRLQGAYISTEETEQITSWYEAQKERQMAELAEAGLDYEDPSLLEPDILEQVRQREAEEAGQSAGDDDGDTEERDKLFRDAAEVVIQFQQGSTSLLQRRLKIGYGRAARIIDQLHSAGVLGPPDGSKAREVLAGFEDLDRICGE
jgi:S-DNA-T family DNA segregation ATPase FtsK/SpoIIIE